MCDGTKHERWGQCHVTALEQVSEAFGDDYDIEVVEAHHNLKVDSPSGTARRIAEILGKVGNGSGDSPNVNVHGRTGIAGTRRHKEIELNAIRGGDIAGDHTVQFAGTGERLEIIHRTHSREAFASGAIRAARWVVSAPKGLHDISEVLFSS